MQKLSLKKGEKNNLTNRARESVIAVMSVCTKMCLVMKWLITRTKVFCVYSCLIRKLDVN